jgi:hypothetical protein
MSADIASIVTTGLEVGLGLEVLNMTQKGINNLNNQSKRKYIGKVTIEKPNGEREAYEVRPKKKAHFNSHKEALNASKKAGHEKLYSKRFPKGSIAIKEAIPIDVFSETKHTKNSSNSNNPFGLPSWEF